MNISSNVLSERQFREFSEVRRNDRPIGYNEKIKWLMMYDQMVEQVICCNKLLCRHFVADRVGTDVLLEHYGHGATLQELNCRSFPRPFVLKATHDSGSTFVVKELKELRWIWSRLRKSLCIAYGLEKGEWGYSHVLPMVIAEQYMKPPVVDYKFHCCQGEVSWIQVIADRDIGDPKEAIVDTSFSRLPLHMDEKFRPAEYDPRRPESWRKMIEIARTLGRGFRYVRVDLYDYEGSPKFGEMTFWPRGGEYRSRDERLFGAMLNFDLSYKRPVIHDFFSQPAIERSVLEKILERLGRGVPYVRLWRE